MSSYNVTERYDEYDEADAMYRYHPEEGLLKQKSVKHAYKDEARKSGWKDSHEGAMRVHGYYPSKYVSCRMAQDHQTFF